MRHLVLDRDRVLADVRARLAWFFAGQDVVLDPAAVKEVAPFLGAAFDPTTDLEVARATGWLQWCRHLVLDPGDDQQRSRSTALRLLEPVYRAQPDDVPEQVRAHFDPGQHKEPSEIHWDEVGGISEVEIESSDSMTVTRKVYGWYGQDIDSRGKVENIWWFREAVAPIYAPHRLDDKTSDADNKTPDDGAAMAEFKRHWDDRETQARTTAKWIATALGAALAALVGTAPLTGLSSDYMPPEAYISAAVGLIFIGITLFLVLRVLVPHVTGFSDLLPPDHLRRSFKRLREKAEAHRGIMLPTGIESLAELGWRADLEAKSLSALAKCILQLAHPREGANEERMHLLKSAQQDRGRWLEVLTSEIIQWTSVASYEVVRKEAWWARTLGLAAGVAGTAAIIVAFTLPRPNIAPASLESYSIVAEPASDALTQAMKELGPSCTAFRGVITSVDNSSGTVQILVQPIAPCRGGLATVPIANLKAT